MKSTIHRTNDKMSTIAAFQRAETPASVFPHEMKKKNKDRKHIEVNLNSV